MVYQVSGSRVEWNPSPARLRELTGELPNASVTEFGNVDVKARVDACSTRPAYLAEDSASSRGSGHAKSKTMLIVGLSGTGKTTTTFTTRPDAYLEDEDESLVPRVRG